MTWETLVSAQDASVNHVLPHSDGGFLEARYVQRVADYFICYLSSHTGCAHSCRFCHLTASKQTMMTPASLPQYIQQAKETLLTYQTKVREGMTPAQYMHFNFMARGDALSNPYFQNESNRLFAQLGSLAQNLNLDAKFLISTIFPHDFNGDLTRLLADPRSTPYYSLYSCNPQFRKRWLPKSWEPERALAALAEFQHKDQRRVVLHWAFIKGQNDSFEDVSHTLDAIEKSGLQAKFNLVRYNPHDTRHGEESEETHLQALFKMIEARMSLEGSRIVPRVGFDVSASCGMFLER